MNADVKADNRTLYNPVKGLLRMVVLSSAGFTTVKVGVPDAGIGVGEGVGAGVGAFGAGATVGGTGAEGPRVGLNDMGGVRVISPNLYPTGIRILTSNEICCEQANPCGYNWR
jgi:hypothetical protein